MTSCDPNNKGNSILVRSVGKQVDGGTVMCQGPDLNKCSWFQGGTECKTIASGEPAVDPSGEIGFYCSQLEAGWCKQASDNVFEGIKECPSTATSTVVPSGTATQTATGTVTVVKPTSTGAPSAAQELKVGSAMVAAFAAAAGAALLI